MCLVKFQISRMIFKQFFPICLRFFSKQGKLRTRVSIISVRWEKLSQFQNNPEWSTTTSPRRISSRAHGFHNRWALSLVKLTILSRFFRRRHSFERTTLSRSRTTDPAELFLWSSGLIRTSYFFNLNKDLLFTTRKFMTKVCEPRLSDVICSQEDKMTKCESLCSFFCQRERVSITKIVFADSVKKVTNVSRKNVLELQKLFVNPCWFKCCSDLNIKKLILWWVTEQFSFWSDELNDHLKFCQNILAKIDQRNKN